MENINALLQNHLRTQTDYPELINLGFSDNPEYDYKFNGVFHTEKKYRENNKEPINLFTKEINGFKVIKNGHMVGFKMEGNFLNDQIKKLMKTENLTPINPNKRRILVDFSSPNIAKNMHVGHLRSTIIGDTLCRLFELQGHEVLRVNHIGDFGLQFGLLIQYLSTVSNFDPENTSVTELQQYYVNAKKAFDTDQKFKEAAYQRVVELQNGDAEVTTIWNKIKEVSRRAYNKIYKRLNVQLNECGESFYQPYIQGLLNDLDPVLVKDQGMKLLKPLEDQIPLILVKSDGGYTYDTTDLTALWYRLKEIKADDIYYVVDSGQSVHFDLVFESGKMLGWMDEKNDVRHVNFGVVTNPDGKRLRTREGDTVKLIDLLNESLERAEEAFDKLGNKHNLNDAEKRNVIEKIAYGSIKYFDLSKLRHKDYKFSYDAMLSLEGNTAVYLMYAYVRICGIIRKANYELTNEDINGFKTVEREEVRVCKHLLQYPEVIEKVNATLQPNHMCQYIYDLSVIFHKFHTKCRCLEYDETRETIINIDKNRLIICIATKRVMETIFHILNIEPIEKM